MFTELTTDVGFKKETPLLSESKKLSRRDHELIGQLWSCQEVWSKKAAQRMRPKEEAGDMLGCCTQCRREEEPTGAKSRAAWRKRWRWDGCWRGLWWGLSQRWRDKWKKEVPGMRQCCWQQWMELSSCSWNKRHRRDGCWSGSWTKGEVWKRQKTHLKKMKLCHWKLSLNAKKVKGLSSIGSQKRMCKSMVRCCHNWHPKGMIRGSKWTHLTVGSLPGSGSAWQTKRWGKRCWSYWFLDYSTCGWWRALKRGETLEWAIRSGCMD